MRFRNYSYGYKILGEGYSSVVYKAKKDKSKQQFAVKIIKEDFLKQGLQKKLLANQIKVHQALKNHKNIVNLIQHGRCENNYVFVMQLCEKGSLADFLEKNKVLSETEAIYIIKQVINAYKAIFQMKVLHRDIKPANILITQQNQIKLCDFGLSASVQQANISQMLRIGTPCFMAPQVAKSNIYTYKADVWSIGVTFYRMIVGELPFKSLNSQNFLKQIKQVSVQKLLPKGISEGSKAFIINTLSIDYHQRMPAEQLFNFQFEQEFLKIWLTSSLSEGDLTRRNKEVLNTKIKQSLDIQKLTKINQQKRVNLDMSMNINKMKLNEQRSKTSPLKTVQSHKKLNLSIKLEKKTQCTQSQQSNQAAQAVQQIYFTKKPQQQIYITPEQHPKENKEKTAEKIQANKNESEERLKQKKLKLKQEEIRKKQMQKLILKQMQKITNIILNQIDFLRFSSKMLEFIQKFFKNQFDLLKETFKVFIWIQSQKLRKLTFVQKEKLKIYMRHPLYNAWAQLIEDYLKKITPVKKMTFRQDDFKLLLQNTIKQIYIEFDKSLKTKLNAGKLITLDYLICLNDLLIMRKKGQSFFTKHSMLNLIMQGLENIKIHPEQIQEVFIGITKKIKDHQFF